MFDIVGVHDTLHHLAVNRQWNIYLRATHYGRPMLVADGMTQLNGGVDDGLWLHTSQCAEVDDHNIAKAQPQDNHLSRLLVIVEYISIVQLCVAFKCYGILLTSTTTHHETTLLGGPLVEVDVIHIDLVAEPVPPFVGNVAYDVIVYLHGLLFS